MLDTFVAHVEQYIHASPWLAVLVVFAGGALTSTNPCVLAMIPLTMSFVAGQGTERKTGPLWALAFSVVFVLGLSVSYTVLGVMAALLGTIYGDVSGVWTWLVAAVCVVMGLHLMGVFSFPIPSLPVQPRTQGAVGALLMGLLFGVVSAPCAAPILVVLLTYLAGSGASVPYGALLLLVYALGHSVLIIIAGTSMGLARKLIESGRVTRITDIMRRCAGGVVICVGAYFIYRGLK